MARRLPPPPSSTGRPSRIRSRGITWFLSDEDNLQRILRLTGTYEPVTLAEVVPRLRPDDVVLDVGANIGAFTVPVAASLTRSGGPGRVIAVEPADDTRAWLERHLSENHLDGRVTVVPYAFGTQAERLELRAAPGWRAGDLGTRSLAGEAGDLPVQIVDVVRGDQHLLTLGVTRVDVLKIDVEGWELQALEGLSELFTDHPPRVVIVEVVDDLLRRAGSSAAALLDWFRSRDYDPYWIRARGLRLVEPGDGREGNVMLLRREGQ